MVANTKAIILKSVPYGESDRIVALFTPHHGKISAFAKSAPFLQPLSLIEASLTPGKKELYHLKEPHLLDPFLPLRDQFPSLKASLQLADFIHRFFPTELPKPHIFDLVVAYLKKISSSKNPDNYYFSFVLKVLHVEGFLDTTPLSSPLTLLITTRKWEEIDTSTLTDEEKEWVIAQFSLIK